MSKEYIRKDYLHQKAKEEGFRSRAAYKLIEVNEKYKIFNNRKSIVDLGSYPGGWLQVAAKYLQKDGRLVGIDLDDIEPFTLSEKKQFLEKKIDCHIIKGDVCDSINIEKIKELLGGKAELIISDMSPKLSGIKLRDEARVFEVVEIAFLSCNHLLKKGGDLLVKVFPSQDLDNLIKDQRQNFEKIIRMNLKSTRGSSKEFYVLGKCFKGEGDT